MKNFKQTSRKCFVCGDQLALHIGDISYTLHDTCPLQPSVSIVACQKCGAIFYDTQASFLDYALYYSAQEWYGTAISCGTGHDSPNEIERYERILKSLQKLLWSEDVRVVDVGCAKGGFLKVLKNTFKNVYGVDPLPSNVQKLNDAGYTAFCATVESLPFEDSSCDVIILSHVLEHIFDVEKALNEISRCLSSKGIVYVEVPNTAQYSSCMAAPLLDFHHEHINHFDAISLNNCFLGRGFKSILSGVQYLPNGLGGDYSIYSIFTRCPVGRRSKLIKSSAEVHVQNLYFKHKQYVNVLQKLCCHDKTFHAWGLSSYMLLMLAELKNIGIEISGLFDRDKCKKDQTYCSVSVQDPGEISLLNSNDVLLMTHGAYLKDMQLFLLQNRLNCGQFVL